jgi:hypothetical protein
MNVRISHASTFYGLWRNLQKKQRIMNVSRNLGLKDGFDFMQRELRKDKAVFPIIK